MGALWGSCSTRGTRAADWQDVIRTLDEPLKPPGALVALHGTLFPDGAIIKAAAASPELMKHRGKAVVFNGLDDLALRIDDPSVGITTDDILVLRNIGPVATGMPEAGAIPVPRYLAQQGVRDIVRISDGRMSGTAYGTVVLHGAPKRPVAGHSRWYATATSSSSMSLRNASTYSSMKTSYNAGEPSMSTRSKRRGAGGANCTPNECSRRTWAPISTSSSTYPLLGDVFVAGGTFLLLGNISASGCSHAIWATFSSKSCSDGAQKRIARPEADSVPRSG